MNFSKIIKVPAILLAILFSVNLSAQKTNIATDKIRVEGNCKSCKKRIEAAAKKTDGVEKAVWSETSNILVVTYKTDKTSAKEIGKNIAAVGHDNALATAPDSIYTSLPACCQYLRYSK